MYKRILIRCIFLWSLFRVLRRDYVCVISNTLMNNTTNKRRLRYFLAVGPSTKRVTYTDINTLIPRQNGRQFADDTFECILLNENVWIPITIWLEFVPKGSINNIPALVQIMAWRRPGDKPLSESMMVSLPTHICVTRPQWVKNGVRKGNYILIQCLV